MNVAGVDWVMTMAESRTVFLTNRDGDRLAELLIVDEDEDWFTGRVVWRKLPFEIQNALNWYNEVVENQMLRRRPTIIVALRSAKDRTLAERGPTFREVIVGPFLSYLDEATAAVQKFELHAKFPDGSTQKPYALHVSPSNSVSFRTSPVLPPPGFANAEMRR
jgi:hypothetical protein